MKIAFSTKGNSWDSNMDSRFGRAQMFLIYDEEADSFVEVANEEVASMEHGVGPKVVKKILNFDANIVITGNGAGEKALKVLNSFDMKFYIGAGDMSVKEAYEAYKNNKLQLQS